MPSTEHKFNTLGYSNLLAGISASAVTAALIPGGVQNFRKGWVSGKAMYLTLVDAARNREIVKVTAIAGDNLTIERAQGGTSARAWPAGTVVSQRPVAENLNGVIQKEGFRSVSSNPNGVLTARYPGEKIYQSGPAAAQRRWFKSTDGTKWRLVAGATYGTEYFDADDYLVTPVTAVILDPNADIAAGGWMKGGGVDPATYTEIDEGISAFNDADFVYNDFPGVAEFAFEDAATAVISQIDVRLRAYCTSTAVGKLGIQLFTGATGIGSQWVIGTDEAWQNADGDDTFHEYDIAWIGVALSAAEADDLRVKLETTQFGVVVRVSVVEIELT